MHAENETITPDVDVDNGVEQESNAEEVEGKTFTQDQLNELLGKRAMRERKAYDKKLADREAEFEATRAEEIAAAKKEAVEDYKAKMREDERLKGLTKSERLEEEVTKRDDELKKANQRIAELEAEQARGNMIAHARELLAEKGIAANDELLNVLVADTAEKTSENIKILEAFDNSRHEAWSKERSKGKTPNLGISNAQKSAFDAIIDKI